MESANYLRKATNWNDDTTSDSDSQDVSMYEELIGRSKKEGLLTSENESAPKGKAGGGATRLPTRKPDPNVYNRNALMARQNRQKKKAHLEELETQLARAHGENKVLSKALKKQLKRNRELEKEKQYFMNIVHNRTEIVQLISALNGRLVSKSPLTPLTNSSIGSNRRGSLSSSICYEPDALAINFDNSENDFEPSDHIESSWDSLLKEDFPLAHTHGSDDDHSEDTHSTGKLHKDHSYICQPEAELSPNSYHNNNNNNNNIEAAGVCLHINGGKISLEFCPKCHSNATKPPLLLLSDTDQNVSSVF